MMNKSGKGKDTIVIVLLVILVASVVTGIYFYAQSVLKAPEVNGLPAGKKTTISSIVYNRAADNPNTQVTGIARYIQNTKDLKFVADASTSASHDANIGDNLEGIAFNSSYYGKKTTMEVKKQGEIMELETWAIGAVTLTLYTEALATGQNLSVPAGLTKRFEYLKIATTSVNTAHRLGGLFVNAVEATNISSFTFAGTVDVIGVPGTTSLTIDKTTNAKASLGRVTTDDWVFEFSTSLMMLEGDELKVHKPTVLADADGCLANGAGGGELVTIYEYDKAHYRSSQIGVGIGFGAETDAASPVDVGDSDRSVTFYCIA